MLIKISAFYPDRAIPVLRLRERVESLWITLCRSLYPMQRSQASTTDDRWSWQEAGRRRHRSPSRQRCAPICCITGVAVLQLWPFSALFPVEAGDDGTVVVDLLGVARERIEIRHGAIIASRLDAPEVCLQL